MYDSVSGIEESGVDGILSGAMISSDMITVAHNASKLTTSTRLVVCAHLRVFSLCSPA